MLTHVAKTNERAKDFSLGDWRFFADQLGYKQGWAWYKWKECQDMGNEDEGMIA